MEGETRFVRVYPYEADGARDFLVLPCFGDNSNTESTGDETEWAVPTPDGSSLSEGEDSEPATGEVELSADQASLSMQASREEEDTLLQEYLEVFPLSQSSPYRSQNAAPPQEPRSDQDGRELAGNKHSTMYVSMDMFREGPDRGWDGDSNFVSIVDVHIIATSFIPSYVNVLNKTVLIIEIHYYYVLYSFNSWFCIIVHVCLSIYIFGHFHTFSRLPHTSTNTERIDLTLNDLTQKTEITVYNFLN